MSISRGRDMFRLRASPGYPMTLCSTALLIWPSLVTADEPLKCSAERDTAKRMECLEKKLETLQKEAASNLVQTGSTTFGQNQSGTPNWPFQNYFRAATRAGPRLNRVSTVICHKAGGLHRNRRRSFRSQSRYRSIGLFGRTNRHQWTTGGHHSKDAWALV